MLDRPCLKQPDSHVNSIAALLGPDFRQQSRQPSQQCGSIVRQTIHHAPTGFAVEFFELSPDPHDQLRFARRVQTTFAGRPIFLPTAEDVIITKLRWSKGGNRRKDVEDVENVIAVQGTALDLPYIRQWCDQHATRDLFERLLVSALQ